MAAAAVSAAAVSAAAPYMATAARSMKEVIVMAAEVVMSFPAVMDVEGRCVAPVAPGIRRVSVGRIA
jgi:hypothetical protein